MVGMMVKHFLPQKCMTFIFRSLHLDYCSNGRYYFTMNIHGFPEELEAGAKIEFNLFELMEANVAQMNRNALAKIFISVHNFTVHAFCY